MFHINFLVDDKKLAEVLTVIDKKVFNLEVSRVTNTIVERGKVKEKTRSGTLIDQVAASLPKNFTTADVAKAVAAVGGSKGYGAGMRRRLIAEKRAKTLGRNSYQLTGK